jgi:hypothetical protein
LFYFFWKRESGERLTGKEDQGSLMSDTDLVFHGLWEKLTWAGAEGAGQLSPLAARGPAVAVEYSSHLSIIGVTISTAQNAPVSLHIQTVILHKVMVFKSCSVSSN